MDTRRAVLDALADGTVSGPALAAELGISRAAVWKAVEGLREEGFAVGSTDDGYVAPTAPPYGAAGIEFDLNVPYTVRYQDVLSSTNTRARALAESGASDVVVVADEQTGGRGRLNRSWDAPSGGVWLSILTTPAVAPARVPQLTLAAAVAVTDACRAVGVDAGIKWPNDVLLEGEKEATKDATAGGEDCEHVGRGGKKLAGILTEMEGEADRVAWLVVGIGVNANVDPSGLPAGATSLRAVRGDPIDRREFVCDVLERYAELTADHESVLSAWRDRAITLGRRVRVKTSTETVVGEAVDVKPPGALVVEADTGTVRVHAGDCTHLRVADRDA
jgi:BirA family biotin operon repressor/biotin-[acetyl-CoA-carboxylase] ligase